MNVILRTNELNLSQKSYSETSMKNKIFLLLFFQETIYCKYYRRQRCSQKSRKIDRKTPVPEPHFKIKLTLKKRLWHRCFPVNVAKFLRTSFLQNTSGGCFCQSLIISIVQIQKQPFRCYSKQVLLKISQYSHKNTSVGISF